jgi:type I restriction enzyme S subunit
MKTVSLGDILKLEYGKPLDKIHRVPQAKYRAYGANGPLSNASKYLVKGPGIIVGRKGSAGEITEVAEDFWPLDVTYYVTHNDKETHLRYLYYVLKSLDLKQFVRGIKPGLNRNDVYGLHALLPSLNEQRAIVEKLDSAFAEIDMLEGHTSSQALLVQNVAASVFDLLLNCQGDKSVSLSALGDLAEKVVVAFVGVTTPHYRAEGVPFLRTQNVTRDGVRLEELKYVTSEFHDKNRKSQLEAGDVLLSRVITDRVTVGVVPRDLGPANCANVIIVRPGAKLKPEYLSAYIASPSAQSYLLSRKVGSAQVVVNTGIVKGWPIPDISMEEQETITRRVTQISDLVGEFSEGLKRKVTLYSDLRHSLLASAFRGETIDA